MVTMHCHCIAIALYIVLHSIDQEDLKVTKDTVLVLQGAGPIGAPGELHMTIMK